ncbi:MAG: zinc-binding dehydrogenase [Lactobacillus sp.]|jgi:NADPH:quinone reductase-like Zn-dependent oxidoreductase|nr:zinc-binding dehydrogenase [Lactobacillus sp.]
MQALFFEKFGGPEVLQYGQVPDPTYGSTDLLVQTTLIGLNFADIYRRQGTYHIEHHDPWINGYEGIGQVVGVGKDVTGYKTGDRVLFVDVPFANAELVRVPAARAIRPPANLSDELAVSIGLQGLTADFLAHDLALNHPDDKVLVYGVSGGVGQILTQILTADKVQVFGVASTTEKRALGLQNGAKQVFARSGEWLAQFAGTFDTVFDGAGVTLNQSFELIKHRGKVVFYGMAGGPTPKLDPVALLAASKSLLTGDLWDYLTTAAARQFRFNRLLRYIEHHQIKLSQPTILPLEQGRQAHELMVSEQNIGKILLKP